MPSNATIVDPGPVSAEQPRGKPLPPRGGGRNARGTSQNASTWRCNPAVSHSEANAPQRAVSDAAFRCSILINSLVNNCEGVDLCRLMCADTGMSSLSAGADQYAHNPTIMHAHQQHALKSEVGLSGVAFSPCMQPCKTGLWC